MTGATELGFNAVMFPRRPSYAAAVSVVALTVAVGLSGPIVAATAGSLPVVLAGAGDIARAGSPSVPQTQTANVLTDLDPDAVFAAGDLQYETGALADFMASYDPTWGVHKAITVPAIGNHEWKTPGASGWKNYWDLNRTWDAYDVGTWRVYVLDTNCTKVGGCNNTSPQFQWLKAQLESDTATCIAAVWHHPLFTSGNHHGPSNKVRPLWRLLDRNDGDVVLVGHAHQYERFGLQDGFGASDPAGMREFVVGTGGDGLQGFASTTMPNSQFRLKAHGVLELTLGITGYSWRFLDTERATRDSGSANC